jgi:hypothetical protein
MCMQGAKGTAADQLRLGLVQLLAAESALLFSAFLVIAAMHVLAGSQGHSSRQAAARAGAAAGC